MTSRGRVFAIVAVVALAAAGVAAAVAWTGRGVEQAAVTAERTGVREGAPPLALDVLVETEAEARALQDAAGLYQAGRRAEARAAFEQALANASDPVYAAVGAALSDWPEGALPALRRVEQELPGRAVVPLHEGLVLFWLGRDAEAQAAWRRAEQVEPDSAAAVRAESLLHPEMPAGRPFFVPGAAPPAAIAELLPLQQLDALRRRAEEEGTGEAWIQYGVALQRAGRPVSAQAAFDRAVEADPGSVEAKAAAAVVRFDKDDPSQAFSRLGPLSSSNPDAPVVRFHLGLLLLWLGDVEQAREELRLAVDAGSGSSYAEEAELLLARLDEAAGATSGAG